MAWYDDAEYGEYYVETTTELDQSRELNEILFGNNFESDARAQELFAQAFFDNDETQYQALVDYLWDTYGLDFEDAFDWEDFRSWYDAA